MPDKRAHRGPHPDDARLFAPDQWPRLRDAVGDLAWLLSRGYASVSALKIVGDRYQLDQRQRNAVSRSSCSDAARDRRQRSRVDLSELAGKTLLVDGIQCERWANLARAAIEHFIPEARIIDLIG